MHKLINQVALIVQFVYNEDEEDEHKKIKKLYKIKFYLSDLSNMR